MMNKIFKNSYGTKFDIKTITMLKRTKIYSEYQGIKIELYNSNIKKELKSRLLVTIENRGETKDDIEIENLKFRVKDILLNILSTDICFWIEDYQVEKVSRDLYLEIHRVENIMRTFLLSIMINTVGIEGWNQYLEKKLKVKKIQIKVENNNFSNVNQQIYNLDVSDIFEIFNFQEKNVKLNIDANLQLNKLKEFCGKKDSNLQNIENEIKEFIENLYDNAELKFSFWEEIFEVYLNKKFKQDWNKFRELRNHVMHNKLLTFMEAEEKMKFLKRLKKLLLAGQEKFNEAQLTPTEKERIRSIELKEQMQQYDQYIYEILKDFNLKYKKEN